MIIRSMSLAAWSVALATEPYTKAALNGRRQRLQGLAQRLRETDRLQHDTPQFRIQRRGRVGLVMLLMANPA